MSGRGISTRHLLLRLYFEELHRKRRFSDQARYVETFRRSAVDPNPHQVEAVSFALSRISEGGALLCDEVGLGKTIETGLILSQLQAEGKSHILIVVPLPLARQWQVELKDLFGLKARILTKENLTEDLPHGIYIGGREFVGSPNWMAKVRSLGPWDLVVIDEAHEMMSSLHVRFSLKDGSYESRLNKKGARRAAAILEVKGDSPALILTATPIQNSLYELWSLVYLVDQNFQVLGPLNQFTRLFTADKGRSVVPEMQNELTRRLEMAVARTLRTQAQPFLKVKFTKRHCHTVNFHMDAVEKDLYDGVTNWLNGRVAVYRSRNRRMIQMNLRKRMGSSLHALAATLKNLLDRLNGQSEDGWEPEEDVDWRDVERDIQEISRLEKLARSTLNGSNLKLEKLWNTLEQIRLKSLDGVSTDKVVIFTESLITVQSIVQFLENQGMRGQITVFQGTNEGPAVLAAVEKWEDEVGRYLTGQERPDPKSSVRAALIHEFKTRTRVLISTESGAKGLNLQFCNCLINYDLPWNPQRIEQRIGRVHRYGQKHDVVIVNFINLDNEGELRVYGLLKDKLQLFEDILGASDSVLGLTGSVVDFEKRIIEIFDGCRSPEEQRRQFDLFELELDEEARKLRDHKLEETRQLIGRLDSDVQARLAQAAEGLPKELSRRDETLLKMLQLAGSLELEKAPDNWILFHWQGRRYHLGPPKPGPEMGEPMTLDHPLLQRLRQQIHDDTEDRCFSISGPPGEWQVYLVQLRGIECEERLLILGPEGLDGLQRALEHSSEAVVWDRQLPPHEALQENLEHLEKELENQQDAQVRRLMKQTRARHEDLIKLLESEQLRLQAALNQAERKFRCAKNPAATSTAQGQVTRLKNELEHLMHTREQQIKESRQEASQREQKLAESRYVETEARRLFAVVSS